VAKLLAASINFIFHGESVRIFLRAYCQFAHGISLEVADLAQLLLNIRLKPDGHLVVRNTPVPTVTLLKVLMLSLSKAPTSFPVYPSPPVRYHLDTSSSWKKNFMAEIGGEEWPKMAGYSAHTNGPGSIDDKEYPQPASFMRNLSPASFPFTIGSVVLRKKTKKTQPVNLEDIPTEDMPTLRITTVLSCL